MSLKKLSVLLSIVMIASMLLSACGTPAPVSEPVNRNSMLTPSAPASARRMPEPGMRRPFSNRLSVAREKISPAGR